MSASAAEERAPEPGYIEVEHCPCFACDQRNRNRDAPLEASFRQAFWSRLRRLSARTFWKER